MRAASAHLEGRYRLHCWDRWQQVKREAGAAQHAAFVACVPVLAAALRAAMPRLTIEERFAVTAWQWRVYRRPQNMVRHILWLTLMSQYPLLFAREVVLGRNLTKER